jgi:hypothetical protein
MKLVNIVLGASVLGEAVPSRGAHRKVLSPRGLPSSGGSDEIRRIGRRWIGSSLSWAAFGPVSTTVRALRNGFEDGPYHASMCAECRIFSVWSIQ